MALKIVGSGVGRTGTMSLKVALEQLGFIRCHHMAEVFMNAEKQVPLWIAAAEGKPDWDAVFDGYAATVDYPGARFWRELADYYPDAKVLHSVRDPEKWFESTQATIFAEASPARNAALPPLMRTFFEKAVFHEFGDKIHDKAFMIEYFKRHTDDVVKAIPKNRLLVYEAESGWEPLCKFLGVPVPEAPFPRANTRENFQARVRASEGQAPSMERLQERMRDELNR